jgi:hypothetical protein
MRQASCDIEVISDSGSRPSETLLPPRLVRESPLTIDKLLTKEEFLMLAAHMHNGNPLSYFLIGWRDDAGSARYAKAKPHKRADVQASWTWDTIVGRAKRRTSLGLYPKNQVNQSTWAAMDFDAHSGRDDVAKDWGTQSLFVPSRVSRSLRVTFRKWARLSRVYLRA